MSEPKFPPMPTALPFMGRTVTHADLAHAALSSMTAECSRRGRALKKLVDLYDEFEDPEDFARCVSEHIDHWRALVANE
jgi:hypothetical protein